MYCYGSATNTTTSILERFHNVIRIEKCKAVLENLTLTIWQLKNEPTFKI